MEEVDVSNLESKTSTEYDGHKRVLYKLTCEHCEADYWRPKKRIEQSKCCSKECYNDWRAKTGKRLTYSCTLCQKEFKRFQHHAAQVESGKLYCSRKCQQDALVVHRTNCLNCNMEVIGKGRIYCGHDCFREHEYKENIRKWKAGELEGINAAEGFSSWLRRYMLDKAGNKCSHCSWNEVNPTTGKIPLQVDHIDGDYKNNKEDNLRVLCPNCHSLTSTYGGSNRGKGREKRRLKLQGNKKESTSEEKS